MVFKLGAVVFLFVMVANASLTPTIEVLQGPSSRTTLLGPDGSAVEAASPGGTVVTDAHGTGVVAAGPAILPTGPQIVVDGGLAGSIATSYTLAGPAVVPTPILAGIPVANLVDTTGNEGGYVADNSEALYDDGSYKGEH